VGLIATLCGLRQGVPPPPYLYIICSEGLSSYILPHENGGHIHGARICRGSPSITHPLKNIVSEVTTLKNIMDIYEVASGRTINYKKSSIALSRIRIPHVVTTLFISWELWNL